MFQFPAAPVVGDLFTPMAGTSYRWNGTAWYLVSPGAISKAEADLAYAPIALKALAPLLNVNPNFLIDQQREGGVYPGAGFLIDGWTIGFIGAGVASVQRVTDPNNAAAKCMEVKVTTAQAVLAGGDIFNLRTDIEGFDAAVLRAGQAGAKKITVQFAFQTSVPGIYAVAIRNNASTRSYVTSINAVDALEHDYAITVAMDTGSGAAWLSDNQAGVLLSIALQAGANWVSAQPNVWTGGNYLGVAGAANFMATVGNTMRIKRFEVFAGDAAQPYTPPDYQKELTKCQRYFFKSFNSGLAVAQGVGSFFGSVTYCNPYDNTAYYLTVPYPVELRAAPAVTYYNPIQASNTWQNQSGGTGSGPALTQINGTKCITIYNAETATDFKGSLMSVHFTANARLS